jgi:hypothetical protein
MTGRTLYFCSHCHGESRLTISNLTFTYTEKHTRDCPNRPEQGELERCLRLITRPATGPISIQPSEPFPPNTARGRRVGIDKP